MGEKYFHDPDPEKVGMYFVKAKRVLDDCASFLIFGKNL